jgi:PhnB protein
MVADPVASTTLQCSIAPWLSVRNSAQAVNFYKSVFGAVEVFRLEDPGGGVVARLSAARSFG